MQVAGHVARHGDSLAKGVNAPYITWVLHVPHVGLYIYLDPSDLKSRNLIGPNAVYIRSKHRVAPTTVYLLPITRPMFSSLCNDVVRVGSNLLRYPCNDVLRDCWSSEL